MRGWLCFLAAMTTASIAIADETTTDFSGVGQRGRPARVVKPVYPAEALARGQTGIVTLEGVAGPDGRYNELSFTPDRPESRIFVDALAKVTPRWEFWNALGPACSPVSIPFRTHVAFEIENGEPRVIVTHAPSIAPPKPAAPAVKAGAHFKPIHRVNPGYPYSMLQRGYTGKTYAKITVDREGNVASVDSQTWASNPKANAKAFDAMAQGALKNWKFPPVPPDEKAPWTGCYEFTWRLRD
jgi:TonB family protein